VYINLASLLKAANVDINGQNEAFKQSVTSLETKKLGVAAGDRIADGLSYPYRLSGMLSCDGVVLNVLAASYGARFSCSKLLLL